MGVSACSTSGNNTSSSHDQEIPTTGPDTNGSAASETATNASIVRPGFQIQIECAADSALNGRFRVGVDGKLTLPYKKSLAVSGKEIAEVQNQLRDLYRPYFKEESPIFASIRERSYWIDVRGLAQKPGKILIRKDSSLDEVIAKAGGFPKESPARFIRIQNENSAVTIDVEEYYRNGEHAPLPPWRGGEVLYFQNSTTAQITPDANEKATLRVIGEVRKPGDVSFRAGADFLYYISEAGGPTRDTDPRKIQIYHGGSGNYAVREFSLDKQTSFPPISKGDTIIVFADHQSPFERFIQSGSGIATIISAVALVILASRNK